MRPVSTPIGRTAAIPHASTMSPVAGSETAATAWRAAAGGRATVALICIFISVRPATSSDTTARESGIGVCAYAVEAIASATAIMTTFFISLPSESEYGDDPTHASAVLM